MDRLYYSGTPGVKVRGVIGFSYGVLVFCVYAGWQLAHTYGLSPGDGGVLAPLWQRLTWAVVVIMIGVAFAFGMRYYGAHHDTFDARMPANRGTTINAPWRSVQLKGNLPWLILDEQGVFTEDPDLRELVRRTFGS